MVDADMPNSIQPDAVPATHEHAPRLLSPRTLLASTLALCAGLAIAWVDTRPGWDDTGITALSLLIAAAVASFVRIPAWLAAVLVACPVVVAEISGGMAVLVAILFALAGALAGVFVRRLTLKR
jgi:hypothetical protein